MTQFLLQTGKRLMSGGSGSGLTCLRIPTVLRNEPLMFVLVAVGAEQLPVTTIGRVVVVIVVLVMDRHFVHVRVVELAGAAAADPRVQLERLAAVALLALLLGASRFRDDAVEALLVRLDSLAGDHGRLYGGPSARDYRPQDHP